MPKTGASGENTKFQQHVAQFLSEVNRTSAARQKAFFRIKEKPYKDTYQAISGTVRGGMKGHQYDDVRRAFDARQAAALGMRNAA